MVYMEKCPKCGKETVYKIFDKRGFIYVCGNEKCDFTYVSKKEEYEPIKR